MRSRLRLHLTSEFVIQAVHQAGSHTGSVEASPGDFILILSALEQFDVAPVPLKNISEEIHRGALQYILAV